ncbi:hypothetical protein RISINGSUN_24 [Erwinia phage vB_EamM_RisingSun]|uniref:SH3 fold domain-containing protein n=2 Tax=Risingsunvirus risingsun TaxID=2560435 RepID=A0A223LJB4_9CAUD|nr:hypothetical protein FDI45_gp024 [Erwinia phage vB_EamM_RisingSun]ASU03646.1 hypothetical protein RISINGSUN_24 [Erwinia phage vB_EamM_RisingSun]ASU03891.1 hypothetical protein JOAD_24 [Erwinia phage vB_EamM_Joad]
MINPNIGDIVDFQLVQSGIYGDKRVEVKITGLLDYNTARLIDPQLNNKHTALFPYFRESVGNVNDPAAYQYMAVTNSAGTTEMVGLPWVLEATFKAVTSRTATYVIQNFREEFRAPIQRFLADLGAVYTMVTNDKQ